VVQVLKLIADAPEHDCGVRELAKAFRLAPSVAHRILTVLNQENLVDAGPVSGRYRLSLEFFRLAWRATSRLPFHQAALPILQSLVATCNETALLGLYDPKRLAMMFVEVVESAHPLRYELQLNRWLPVHAGATGLAIMAFLPEEERRTIVARSRLDPVTERTIQDPGLLGKELERIRHRGYACTHGQRIPGAVGLAAPVWGPDGRVVGDVALTVPDYRFEPNSERRLGELLIRHAEQLTTELGGRRPGLAVAPPALARSASEARRVRDPRGPTKLATDRARRRHA
jgi:DNA-binding IclR family transcriptional regulator